MEGSELKDALKFMASEGWNLIMTFIIIKINKEAGQLLRLKPWAEVMPTTSIFTWMSGAEGGCLRAATEPEALDSMQAWLE